MYIESLFPCPNLSKAATEKILAYEEFGTEPTCRAWEVKEAGEQERG